MIYFLCYALNQRGQHTNNSSGELRQQDKAKMSIFFVDYLDRIPAALYLHAASESYW